MYDPKTDPGFNPFAEPPVEPALLAIDEEIAYYIKKLAACAQMTPGRRAVASTRTHQMLGRLEAIRQIVSDRPATP